MATETVSKDAGCKESEAANESNETTVPQLEIEFGGLCAFVTSADAVFALLVAAERSSVRRPKLCRHRRYLTFPSDETLLGTTGGEFYSSYLGPDGKPWSLWDIDGCDLEIGFEGNALAEPPPIRAAESYDHILDLDGFSGEADPWWLESPLDDEEIVGARFRLETGVLGAGELVEEPWTMCLRKTGCNPASGQHFGHSVRYRVPEISDRTVIKAFDHRTGASQEVRLGFGAKITVSNFCVVTAGSVGVERDVLAYYDLGIEPKPIDQRSMPFARSFLENVVVPGHSACPPAKMTAGPRSE